MKKIICTLAAIVALSNITLAQTEKSVGSVEIDVIDQYKASIKKATKISNQPDFVDSTRRSYQFNTAFTQRCLSTRLLLSPSSRLK